MGGFGGSRVSAQPVRAGGHCAGHGRPRKFVLQAQPRPPRNRLRASRTAILAAISEVGRPAVF